MESAGWDARCAAAEGLVRGAEPNRFVVADLTAWPPPADGGNRDALDTVVVDRRP